MGASASPDGRYIYASARTGAAGYNQMLGTTQVVMYDRQTGKVERRTQNMGTGFRPAMSPDGKTLAFGSRRMAVTGLKLRDLASGDEKWIATDIQRDDIESRGSRDLLPGYSWTPDSKALVLAHHGKIWRVMYKGDKNAFDTTQLAAMEKRKTTRAYIKAPDPVADNLQRGDELEGSILFNTYCANCHQRNGKAQKSVLSYPFIFIIVHLGITG